MARKRKKRTSYTPEQRSKILAAAKKEGLTAKAIQKRFGVAPVTYYSWRKKTGAVKRRGRGSGVGTRRNVSLSGQLRTEVQARMRTLLPRLVQAEVSRYLDEALGTGGRRRQ